MARMRYIILMLLFVLVEGQLLAQQNVTLSKEVRRYVRKGNKQFRAGDHEQATVHYQNALDLDSTSTLINYNLATAMFPVTWQDLTVNEKRDTIMMHHFLAAANPDIEPNPERRAMAYHNLGVMHQVNAIHYGKGSEKWQSEMQSAVEAYKDALRNNPTDDQTRYNLVLCLRQLPKGNNDQNSTPPPPEQQQEQEQKDEEQQKNQNNDQQQQDQKQDQQQDQQQQDQQSENPDKDWMEQMINAAEQKERQTMRRLNEQKDKNQERAGQRRPLEKNW